MNKNQIHSLYIHFPYCRHLCNYCDFYKHKLSSENDDITTKNFNSKLINQFSQLEHFHSENNFQLGVLETLYIGGGTPSLWGEKGIQLFSNKVDRSLKLKANCEFTLEVDPGTATFNQLDQWQKLGVNRFSCGVQSVDDNYLALFDRFHRLEDVENLLNYFFERDINFSVDLLLGAPQGREKRNIQWEINKILQFKPKHLSVYILSTRKNYPLFDSLPEDDLIEKEYFFVADVLQGHGFNHYEVSNFAIPGFESMHNQAYWKMDSVAAAGPIGTGFLYQKGHETALRYQSNSSLDKITTEILNKKQLCLERLYLSLRSNIGVQLGDNLAQYNLSKESEKLFNQWVNDGFGVIGNDKFIFNYRGWIMLDTFISKLFPFHLD
ncbi:radical SAM protein [Bacteriovoracaceae bacterium]|nr:radical SAM protein [Bacteriovoracaceae bacterium]